MDIHDYSDYRSYLKDLYEEKKEKDARFSYLRTKDDVEVDLIAELPGQRLAMIEIKSTRSVHADDIASVGRLARDLGDAKPYCLSLDPVPKVIGGVTCLPWTQGIQDVLGI